MNTAKPPAPVLLQPPPFSRRKLFLTLPGLAAGFQAVVAVAAETTTAEPAPLRVGVSPVFPPMVFLQGKELAGVEVDLARALGEKLGRKVVFVELDWKDQTEALVARKTDIIMSSMSMTPARNAVMSFTRPYFKVGQLALVRREDRNEHLFGVMVPPDTKVAVIKATTGDFLVQREFPKANRKAYASGAEAARALMKGSVDLVIADSTLVWYLAGTHAADGLSAVPFALSEEVLAWGVRRGNDDLLAAANEFIARATQDGTLAKTFRRWMAVE
jgi:polar amino acid transport system substrate-binding protein